MYQDLKELFGKEIPSVKKFNLKLSTLPVEMHPFYYKAAYDTAFTEWDTLTKSYRTFLTNLLLHDKQRTADYLRRHTVFGSLVYILREPVLLRRLLSLSEGKGNGGVPSYRHLSFCLLLAFDFSETVDYLSDKLRKDSASTDDLCDLMDLVHLDNEPGCLRPHTLYKVK